MAASVDSRDPITFPALQAARLSTDQVEMIEAALKSVGDYGEVRLVVEKGRVRYVVTQKSVDALKWRAEEGGQR